MIEYFEIPELPGRKFFACTRLRAKLQVTACEERWKRANDKPPGEIYDPCKNCQLGARHAGVDNASLSPLCGMAICARCHRGTTRLVNKHLCISCYNREREVRVGRNSRGTKPVKHPPIAKIKTRVKAGGEIVNVERQAVGMDEVVVALLRDTGKQVTFGLWVPRPGVPQRDMFE